MRELGRARFVHRGARLVILGLCVSGLAFGAGKGSEQADALFRQAVQLAQSGDFVQAADKFRASYQLEPSPGALQGLAMAEERAGKLLQAQSDFVQLQRLATERKDKKRQKLAEERLAAIAPRLAKLTLAAKRSPPDGAHLRFDGSELPLSQLGAEMPADPGNHVIEGTAPDGSSFELPIQLAEGQSKTLSIEWIAKPAPTPAAKPAPRHSERRPVRQRSGSNLDVAGVVTAGVGLALVGVGTYFTVRAGKTYDDVQSQCPNDRCPGSLRSEVDSGRQQETLGRVGLALGGAAIATGVVLYVVGSNDKKRSREAEPASLGAFVGPRGIGMLGSF